MIRTIVTPIDGSMHAQMALDLSVDLAARYDAQLVLLHVGVRDENVPDELYDAASRELEDVESKGQKPELESQESRHLRVLEHMGNRLLRDAQEQAESKGVSRTDTVIDVGDASEQILHHAKERAADLIVMGSRGLGDLEGLFLGSVSHKVFHRAPCSCVTVNRKGAQPVLGEIKSILVASDGSTQADKAVELASEIAGKYGARLTLLYAMWRGPSLEQFRASVDLDQLSESARDELDPAQHPIAEHMSSAFIPPVLSKDTRTEIGEQVLARGRRTAEAKGARAPNLILRDGDPARTIVNFAGREQADLVAIGSRGLGGPEGFLAGSVSYKVSHTASCSCMVVR